METIPDYETKVRNIPGFSASKAIKIAVMLRSYRSGIPATSNSGHEKAAVSGDTI